MSKQHKIYLGLTTTQSYKSSWKEKVEEINSLGIKEIAVYLTGLELSERQELYTLLEKTKLEYVPFVHLRHDSTIEEIEYFKKRYKTKLFNIHVSKESLDFYLSVPERKEIIFLENTDKLGAEFFDNLNSFAGICLDVAHMEDFGFREKNEGYEKFSQILDQQNVGFAHISSVRDEKSFAFGVWHYSAHFFEKVCEFDYLKKYRALLPGILALEVENTLSE